RRLSRKGATARCRPHRRTGPPTTAGPDRGRAGPAHRPDRQDQVTPTITSVEVVPVAGYDSMLLNLSGAHGPFFTRNVVIVTDSSGKTGLGEVPGGEKIAS